MLRNVFGIMLRKIVVHWYPGETATRTPFQNVHSGRHDGLSVQCVTRDDQ